MSDVDNDITKGVVTCALIGLYFIIAIIVKALNTTPKIDIMSPIDPAKSAATSENANSFVVFIAYIKRKLYMLFIHCFVNKWYTLFNDNKF